MISLPKTMENNEKMRTSAEPNKIYISFERFDESYSKI